MSTIVGVFEMEGTSLRASEGATLDSSVGGVLSVGDCDFEGESVVGARESDGAMDFVGLCERDGAREGIPDIDGGLLVVGCRDSPAEGAGETVGSGFCDGARLMLGRLETVGVDDIVGLVSLGF